MSLLDKLLLSEGWFVLGILALAVTLIFSAPTQRRSVLLQTISFLLCQVGHFLAVELAGIKWAANLLQVISFTGEGVTAISLLAILGYSVILVRLKVAVPTIVQDVTVAAAQGVWLLYCLSQFGVNLTGIITTSAVLTAVVGLSMQDTLGNIFGGLALQLDKSLHVGDWVRVDDLTGMVREMRWRFTSIETRNWETVLIPNSILVKSKFLVLGRREGKPIQWRRWVYFNVDFRTSPTVVIEVLERTLKTAKIPLVSTDPLPNCVLMDFTESYGHYAVRYWLTDIAIDDPTDSEVRCHIYSALMRAGIPLSIPAHALFLTQETEERKAIKATRDLPDRTAALNHIEVMRSLPSEDLQHLAENLVFAPFSKGDMVTRQGLEAHWLYIFVEGTAEVSVSNVAGASKKVLDLGPGSFFGEWSLMTGEPREASVMATTAVKSYRLNKSSFEDILRARPQLAEGISSMLEKRHLNIENALQSLDEEGKRVTHTRSDILTKIKTFFALDGATVKIS